MYTYVHAHSIFAYLLLDLQGLTSAGWGVEVGVV